jgi:hypothetical protein
VFQSISRSSCFLAFLFVAACSLAQTEFSADIVSDHKQGSTSTASTARVYFAKDKMRIEPQDKDPKSMGAFIMNFATQTSIVIMPAQHMYMEMPASIMNEKGTYSFFRTGDVENACGDWLKVPHNQGGTCRKVGNETVNGRNTVKYEGTNSSGESSEVWLDPKLRFPVKWAGKSGTGEMKNIQEGSQPASLFDIPAGFTKMDMGGMMKQH